MLMLLAGSAAAEPPRAQLDSGVVQGTHDDGILAFKGIPYAAPPIGDLRWRPPAPTRPWTGVRPATDYGHDCVQHVIPGDAGASGAPQSEDCLVVNVWRPALTAPGEKLPVLVWIHGGGFLNGAASVPFFDGSEFARDGIVLVSFNYRLGRLGFFAHPALVTEHAGPVGDYAFLDQLAALQWVHRNIAAFGGDPAEVTIAGESAGGVSVVQLLTWPAARGLFQRAIVMSGGGRSYLAPTRLLGEAEATGIAFALAHGITDTGARGLAALRALPVTTVNAGLSMAALLIRPDTYAGGPIVDGDVVRGPPEARILAGEFAHVPLLVGTVGDDLGGDREMHEPARFLARQWSAAGETAWVYRFDYVAQAQRPDTTHAPHASELPFFFDQLDARYSDVRARDRWVAKQFQAYIANFVRTGDPNGDGLPTWSPFRESRYDLMLFDASGRARFRSDPRKTQIEAAERQQGT